MNTCNDGQSYEHSMNATTGFEPSTSRSIIRPVNGCAAGWYPGSFFSRHSYDERFLRLLLDEHKQVEAEWLGVGLKLDLNWLYERAAEAVCAEASGSVGLVARTAMKRAAEYFELARVSGFSFDFQKLARPEKNSNFIEIRGYATRDDFGFIVISIVRKKIEDFHP